jgi:hypothetical protein
MGPLLVLDAPVGGGRRPGLGEPTGPGRDPSAVASGEITDRLRGGTVREFSVPLNVEVPTTGNLTDDVVSNAHEAPDAVVFSRRTGAEWSDVTAQEFLDEVRAVAKGLVAAGLQPGERVALIS